MKTALKNILHKLSAKTAADSTFILSKYVRNRAARKINTNAANELETLLLHTDCIAALYYPTSKDDQKVPVQEQPLKGKLPVPPEKFWHWYAQSEESYLKSGKKQARIFRDAALQHGVPFTSGQRILDFGCSGGRVLRWFEEEAYRGVECWGCDIDAAAIDWAQKNMMPPFNFFTNSTSPHLPFSDNFFDLIFAGSVFTHIKDMASIWLLELARCIKKDGLGIFTIIDEDSLDTLFNLVKEKGDLAPEGAKYIVENNITKQTLKVHGFITRDSSPWWLGTLYSRDFFIRRASMAFDVLEVKTNMKGYQTGYVLRPK